jgi:hypothetical protein
MERRDLFRILGASLVIGEGALAQHHTAVPRPAKNVVAGYKPRALSAVEYETVGALCEIIIPTDDRSPGAITAGVPYFLDTTLLYAPAASLAAWRKGLDAVEQRSKQHWKRTFLALTPAEQIELVTEMARNEVNPQSELERFFVLLKSQTLNAYYLSEVGRTEELGYRGNQAVKDFPGCRHPEHHGKHDG